MAGQTIRIGSVEITVARDSYWEAAPIDHLRDRQNQPIPASEFAPYTNDPGRVHKSRVLSFVVRSQGKTILLDAGVGGWGLWRFGNGHLLDSLSDLGVRPEEIDVVIPSHLHLDHVGWNTHPGNDGEPVITFPRAKYLFHKADWDFFTAPERLDPETALGKVAATCLLPVRDADHMELVDHEADVTDEVTVMHTPGHTPGSVSVLVKSGGEAAIFIGDLAHLCMQLTEHNWSPAYENDREEVARSRQRMVEEAVGRNALLAGPHLEEGPVFGRMVMLNGRRMWRGAEL